MHWLKSVLCVVVILYCHSDSTSTTVQASVQLTKLGLYDYFVDESSPVVFNGKLLMFESIVEASPQWAGHWLPEFQNCSCYYRIRDQATGVVIVNLTDSCNHAFGEALVQTNDEGLDTLFVFGTPWIRMNEPTPPKDEQTIGKPRMGLRWGGPCSEGNCSVDAFYSSDPLLLSWKTQLAVIFPQKLVYNNDVAHVGPPSLSQFERQARNGLPFHQWVMILEGQAAQFYVSNSSDPTDPSGWVALDPAVYSVDRFGNGQIGSCPSIRYDPAAGYYYVLTGGNAIILLRSQSLASGSWELAENNGQIIVPNQEDCELVTIPGLGGWYVPDATAAGLIATCRTDSTGFGDDSDVDLSEIVINGTVITLFQYGSGNQATFGFSNLAWVEGVAMFDVLESFFS